MQENKCFVLSASNHCQHVAFTFPAEALKRDPHCFRDVANTQLGRDFGGALEFLISAVTDGQSTDGDRVPHFMNTPTPGTWVGSSRDPNSDSSDPHSTRMSASYRDIPFFQGGSSSPLNMYSYCPGDSDAGTASRSNLKVTIAFEPLAKSLFPIRLLEQEGPFYQILCQLKQRQDIIDHVQNLHVLRKYFLIKYYACGDVDLLENEVNSKDQWLEETFAPRLRHDVNYGGDECAEADCAFRSSIYSKEVDRINQLCRWPHTWRYIACEIEALGNFTTGGGGGDDGDGGGGEFSSMGFRARRPAIFRTGFNDPAFQSKYVRFLCRLNLQRVEQELESRISAFISQTSREDFRRPGTFGEESQKDRQTTRSFLENYLQNHYDKSPSKFAKIKSVLSGLVSKGVFTEDDIQACVSAVEQRRGHRHSHNQRNVVDDHGGGGPIESVSQIRLPFELTNSCFEDPRNFAGIRVHILVHSPDYDVQEAFYRMILYNATSLLGTYEACERKKPGDKTHLRGLASAEKLYKLMNSASKLGGTTTSEREARNGGGGGGSSHHSDDDDDSEDSDDFGHGDGDGDDDEDEDYPEGAEFLFGGARRQSDRVSNTRSSSSGVSMNEITQTIRNTISSSDQEAEERRQERIKKQEQEEQIQKECRIVFAKAETIDIGSVTPKQKLHKAICSYERFFELFIRVLWDPYVPPSQLKDLPLLESFSSPNNNPLHVIQYQAHAFEPNNRDFSPVCSIQTLPEMYFPGLAPATHTHGRSLSDPQLNSSSTTHTRRTRRVPPLVRGERPSVISETPSTSSYTPHLMNGDVDDDAPPRIGGFNSASRRTAIGNTLELPHHTSQEQYQDVDSPSSQPLEDFGMLSLRGGESSSPSRSDDDDQASESLTPIRTRGGSSSMPSLVYPNSPPIDTDAELSDDDDDLDDEDSGILAHFGDIGEEAENALIQQQQQRLNTNRGGTSTSQRGGGRRRGPMEKLYPQTLLTPPLFVWEVRTYADTVWPQLEWETFPWAVTNHFGRVCRVIMSLRSITKSIDKYLDTPSMSEMRVINRILDLQKATIEQEREDANAAREQRRRRGRRDGECGELTSPSARMGGAISDMSKNPQNELILKPVFMYLQEFHQSKARTLAQFGDAPDTRHMWSYLNDVYLRDSLAEFENMFHSPNDTKGIVSPCYRQILEHMNRTAEDPFGYIVEDRDPTLGMSANSEMFIWQSVSRLFKLSFNLVPFMCALYACLGTYSMPTADEENMNKLMKYNLMLIGGKSSGKSSVFKILSSIFIHGTFDEITSITIATMRKAPKMDSMMIFDEKPRILMSSKGSRNNDGSAEFMQTCMTDQKATLHCTTKQNIQQMMNDEMAAQMGEWKPSKCTTYISMAVAVMANDTRDISPQMLDRFDVRTMEPQITIGSSINERYTKLQGAEALKKERFKEHYMRALQKTVFTAFKTMGSRTCPVYPELNFLSLTWDNNCTKIIGRNNKSVYTDARAIEKFMRCGLVALMVDAFHLVFASDQSPFIKPESNPPVMMPFKMENIQRTYWRNLFMDTDRVISLISRAVLNYSNPNMLLVLRAAAQGPGQYLLTPPPGYTAEMIENYKQTGTTGNLVRDRELEYNRYFLSPSQLPDLSCNYISGEQPHSFMPKHMIRGTTYLDPNYICIQNTTLRDLAKMLQKSLSSTAFSEDSLMHILTQAQETLFRDRIRTFTRWEPHSYGPPQGQEYDDYGRGRPSMAQPHSSHGGGGGLHPYYQQQNSSYYRSSNHYHQTAPPSSSSSQYHGRSFEYGQGGGRVRGQQHQHQFGEDSDQNLSQHLDALARAASIAVYKSVATEKVAGPHPNSPPITVHFHDFPVLVVAAPTTRGSGVGRKAVAPRILIHKGFIEKDTDSTLRQVLRTFSTATTRERIVLLDRAVVGHQTVKQGWWLSAHPRRVWNFDSYVNGQANMNYIQQSFLEENSTLLFANPEEYFARLHWRLTGGNSSPEEENQFVNECVRSRLPDNIENIARDLLDPMEVDDIRESQQERAFSGVGDDSTSSRSSNDRSGGGARIANMRKRTEMDLTRGERESAAKYRQVIDECNEILRGYDEKVRQITCGDLSKYQSSKALSEDLARLYDNPHHYGLNISRKQLQDAFQNRSLYRSHLAMLLSYYPRGFCKGRNHPMIHYQLRKSPPNSDDYDHLVHDGEEEWEDDSISTNHREGPNARRTTTTTTSESGNLGDFTDEHWRSYDQLIANKRQDVFSSSPRTPPPPSNVSSDSMGSSETTQQTSRQNDPSQVRPVQDVTRKKNLLRSSTGRVPQSVDEPTPMTDPLTKSLTTTTTKTSSRGPPLNHNHSTKPVRPSARAFVDESSDSTPHNPHDEEESSVSASGGLHHHHRSHSLSFRDPSSEDEDEEETSHHSAPSSTRSSRKLLHRRQQQQQQQDTSEHKRTPTRLLKKRPISTTPPEKRTPRLRRKKPTSANEDLSCDSRSGGSSSMDSQDEIDVSAIERPKEYRQFFDLSADDGDEGDDGDSILVDCSSGDDVDNLDEMDSCEESEHIRDGTRVGYSEDECDYDDDEDEDENENEDHAYISSIDMGTHASKFSKREVSHTYIRGGSPSTACNDHHNKNR